VEDIFRVKKETQVLNAVLFHSPNEYIYAHIRRNGIG
jgi:hypothetical protein